MRKEPMFNTKEKEILDMINEDTFVISDTHFNHANILTFEPTRQTAMMIDGYDLANHEEWLIENWNSVVKPDDVVLHMGDFAFKGIQELEGKLNGFKILILGNHDRKGIQTYNKTFDYVIRGLWVEAGIEQKHYLQSKTTDELTSMLIKTIGNEKVLFCHYPVCESELRWSEGKKYSPMTDRLLVAKDLYYEYGCTMNIHGHTHSNNMVDRDTRVFRNVSMENIDMKPRRIKDII
jgi:calcineurin-like phosphoesterase family protein